MSIRRMTPEDEALYRASLHLGGLLTRVGTIYTGIISSTADGILTINEHMLQSVEEDINLAFIEIRNVLNKKCKPSVVIIDPGKGEEPLYPNQPTHNEKYGHPCQTEDDHDWFWGNICRLCGATK